MFARLVALAALAALMRSPLPARAAQPDAPAGAPAPVIILKLDDVTRSGAHGQAPVSPRWQRVADFVEREKIKASFGILGYSLEEDHEAYFTWIKDLAKRGSIEFWNHGFENRADRFKGTPLAEQKEALLKVQRLAKQKLGLTLHVFGPHWGPTDKNTEAALAEIPEIRVWFFGPPRPQGGQVSLERTLNLEATTFVPDFEKFKDGYERFGRLKPYLALQGHPNAWTDERWENFVKIVGYLKDKGCTFMTPSQYVASVRGAGK